MTKILLGKSNYRLLLSFDEPTVTVVVHSHNLCSAEGVLRLQLDMHIESLLQSIQSLCKLMR
jgi:hypothetical protein